MTPPQGRTFLASLNKALIPQISRSNRVSAENGDFGHHVWPRQFRQTRFVSGLPRDVATAGTPFRQHTPKAEVRICDPPTEVRNSGVQPEQKSFTTRRQWPRRDSLCFGPAKNVSSKLKMDESSKMELTYPVMVASSAGTLRRCVQHIAEGGRSERDLRDEKGGPFDPGTAQELDVSRNTVRRYLKSPEVCGPGRGLRGYRGWTPMPSITTGGWERGWRIAGCWTGCCPTATCSISGRRASGSGRNAKRGSYRRNSISLLRRRRPAATTRTDKVADQSQVGQS